MRRVVALMHLRSVSIYWQSWEQSFRVCNSRGLSTRSEMHCHSQLSLLSLGFHSVQGERSGAASPLWVMRADAVNALDT